MDYPVVIKTEKGSPAQRAGISEGDKIISINGEHISDVLDYRFFSADPELYITLLKQDGEEKEVYIANDSCEDLGIELCYGDNGKTRRCKNKCIFCFIDQMPPGMRPSLYLKDDDVRLSFLTGLSLIHI